MAKGGWTYIMTNKPHGVLYTGVAAHLAQRVDQHRRGVGSKFCKRYGLTMLVYAEPHDGIDYAITREKAIKAWKREWKIQLIESINPEWKDLFDGLA
ncbi:MAG: GIY-YIG nuclease family protein [Pseudomonadota bacterium]